MRISRRPRTQSTVARICPLLTIPALVPIMLISTVYASTSLTVKVSHGGGYSATASRVLLTDTHSHLSTVCPTIGSTPGSQTSGEIINGNHSGTRTVEIGKVIGLAFHHCTPGPAGGPVTIKSRKLPYDINVDSATNGKGETDLIISGINFSWVAIGCNFTVTGSAQGYYRNSTHSLYLTPTPPIKPLSKAQLTISNISGCAGIYSNGDHITIKVTYPLSIPVKISSA